VRGHPGAWVFLSLDVRASSPRFHVEGKTAIRAPLWDVKELMLSVAEARVLIEDYRRHYNDERPHGGISYRTPAQARLEALGSSRPSGSLRQELESTNTPVNLQT
jgi:hypothetical protein